MKTCAQTCMALVLMVIGSYGWAQTSSAPGGSTQADHVPLSQLISTVARSAGRKFIIDPRVQGEALIVGQNPADLTYGDLLIVLQVNGFAAVEGGGYVRVVPDAIVRAMALPQISANDNRPDAEYVSRVVPVRNIPAASLVPILRPLLPQQAHLAAAICSNTLIVVDTFANVKRIEALVQSVDMGEPYRPKKCETAMPERATASR